MHKKKWSRRCEKNDQQQQERRHAAAVSSHGFRFPPAVDGGRHVSTLAEQQRQRAIYTHGHVIILFILLLLLITHSLVSQWPYSLFRAIASALSLSLVVDWIGDGRRLLVNRISLSLSANVSAHRMKLIRSHLIIPISILFLQCGMSLEYIQFYYFAISFWVIARSLCCGQSAAVWQMKYVADGDGCM